MSIFDDIGSNNKENKTDKVLADSLSKLVGMMDNLTEYSNRQILPLSLLQANKYYAKYLEFYIKNKKHVKRKFSKELLKVITAISETIGSKLNESNGLVNFFDRSKR